MNNTVRRKRFQERRHLFGALLLLSLLFGGHYLPEILTLMVMVAVTWMAMISLAGLRGTMAISLAGFLLPFSILAWSHWKTFDGQSLGIRSSLEISLELTVLCSMVYAAIEWVKSILRSQRAGFDEVLGACNLYMWIATIFACFYTLTFRLGAQAFHFQEILNKATGADAIRQSFDEFFYFSFVTQTTLGYGDIVPISHFARALSVTQAIIGQFYVAVVLTYILNLWIRDLGRQGEHRIETPNKGEQGRKASP